MKKYSSLSLAIAIAAMIGVLIIFVADAQVENRNIIGEIKQAGPECEYFGRCIEDMYLYWHSEVPGSFYRTDSTKTVRDGEGGTCVSHDCIWFLMEMGALERVHTGTLWVELRLNSGLIVGYDPSTCDIVDTIRLREYGPSPPFVEYYGLAYNEDDGSFWYSIPLWPVVFPPEPPMTTIYHIDGTGNMLDSFIVQDHAVTGLALDTDNNHLWCIARGNPDMFLEYNVSTGNPFLIQGPFEVPWYEPIDSNSAAGLDYDEERNLLVAINVSANYLEGFYDIDPDYPGPPDTSQPGVESIASCEPDHTPDAWGIALVETTVYVAGDGPEPPFPMDEYKRPPSVIFVCPDGSGDFELIQLGINTASRGDTVILCDTTFRGPGNKNIDFWNKEITLRSNSGNPDTCVIDCEGDGRGFYFHRGEGPKSVVKGIKIANGYSSDGAGVLCMDYSSPSIIGCLISGNRATTNGGGIYCLNHADPDIISCTISGNKAEYGGGICCEENSSGNLKNTILWGNCADYGEEAWLGNSEIQIECCDVDTTGIDGVETLWVRVIPPNIFRDPIFFIPENCENAPTTKGNYCIEWFSSCTPDSQPECGLIGAMEIVTGDVNKDGQITIADAVYIVNFLFRGGPPPDPLCMGDVNCDGVVTLADVVYLVNWLFRGGPPPCCNCVDL